MSVGYENVANCVIKMNGFLMTLLSPLPGSQSPTLWGIQHDFAGEVIFALQCLIVFQNVVLIINEISSN